MIGATCFSGIGAPECAAPWVDWRWAAEIEPFPSAVHAHRFPGTVNLGDVLAPDFLARASAEPIDILVGGPPCQAFSIAGLRNSLADARGNLTLRWAQVIHAVRPGYAVTENVPGWLSTKDNAFGCFLAGLVGSDDPLRTPDGGSWPDAGMAAGPLGRAAWRVLDAQHFGVPQRRRRVFAVFCPPDGGDPAAILFEPKGLRRHPAPGREAREELARPLAAGSPRGSGYRNDADTAENLIAFDTTQITSKANYSNPRPGDPCHPLAAGAHASDIAHCLNADPSRRIDGESETFVVAMATDGHGSVSINHHATGALTAQQPSETSARQFAIAFGWQNSPSQGASASASVTPTLDKSKTPGVSDRGGCVRRLTPTECERLQGFPDGWTDIVYRGKPAADGPRYKAIGNSMAVPVLAWLLDRIRQVDAIQMARSA